MPDLYEQIKARIQAAIASIPPDTKPNIAKKARDFVIPETRLRVCYKGRGNRSNCGGTGQILTDAQEQALVFIIKREETDKTYLYH